MRDGSYEMMARFRQGRNEMPCDLNPSTFAWFALAVVLVTTATAGLRCVWPRVQDTLYRVVQEMVDY